MIRCVCPRRVAFHWEVLESSVVSEGFPTKSDNDFLSKSTVFLMVAAFDDCNLNGKFQLPAASVKEISVNISMRIPPPPRHTHT